MSQKETKESSSVPIIQVKGITKKYGKKVVHRGIDLDVYDGEILTLMGGSGCGKSVLLRSLIGLEKPDRGQILFHGQDIAQMDEEQLTEVRKKVAYVFQYGALFDSLTVKDNLAYPLREHTKMTEDEIHQKVIKTLGKVGLEGVENQFPSDLSGGMQRRVGVARSIIMDPEVILYDEPTTGLDPYNTKQILRIIKELRDHGATTVLVTHDMHSIFTVTDRIAFMRDGLIDEIGQRDVIRKSSNDAVQRFIHGETP